VAVPEVHAPILDASAGLLGDDPRFRVEVVHLTVGTTPLGRALDVEVGVLDRQRDGQIVVVQQARGAVALHIGELVVVVVGQHEQAVLLPLERLLASVGGPDGGQPAAVDDVDHLVDAQVDGR
jgi:hypothetical protein